MIGGGATIEIWAKGRYEEIMNAEDLDIESLAEDVMGDISFDDE